MSLSLIIFDIGYLRLSCMYKLNVKINKQVKSKNDLGITNLLIAIQDFQFLTCLHIINKIFGTSIFFCRILQKTQIDIDEASTYVANLTSELNQIRKKC